MNDPSGSRPHVGEEDLLRYLDGQLPRPRSRRVRDHVEGCAACAARLDELRARADDLSRWLGALDVPVDAARRDAARAAMSRARFRRPWLTDARVGLSAAAVVLLLIVAGVGTRPGRAVLADVVEGWAGDPPGPLAAAVLDWLGQPPASLASASEAKAAGDSAPESAAADEPRPAAFALPPGAQPPVHFDAPGPDITITFRSRQEAGVVSLWIREVDQASGQVTAGSGGEVLVQGERGLVVRNGRGSRADYEVVVPAHYRAVRLRVGDEPESVLPITKSKIDGLWTIPVGGAID